MRLETPFAALHEALSAACNRDLPLISYETRDWDKWKKLSEIEKQNFRKNNGELGITKTETRHHMTDDVEVILFPELWGSTALGYGGIGGAAMTPAYTVIVHNKVQYCVYFGCGRLAYMFDSSNATVEQTQQFWSWVDKRQMPDIREYNLKMSNGDKDD